MILVIPYSDNRESVRAFYLKYYLMAVINYKMRCEVGLENALGMYILWKYRVSSVLRKHVKLVAVNISRSHKYNISWDNLYMALMF